MTHLELEECFRAHYKTLRDKAFYIVRDWDLAEDVVQDTFLKLLSNEAEHNPDLSQPLTWLVNIVGRQALNAKRDRDRDIDVEADYAMIHGQQIEDINHVEEEEAHMLQNLRKALVKEWLDTDGSIAEGTREAIRAVYFDGSPVSKQAEILGVHPEILRRRVDKAFTKWHKRLKRMERNRGVGNTP